MTLSQAIKSLVEEYGESIFVSPKFISMLDDMQVFKDRPSSKYLMKSFMNDGSIQKFFNILATSDDIENRLNNFLFHLQSNTGFDKNEVYYIFNEIRIGITNKTIDRRVDSDEYNETTHKEENDPWQVNLNASMRELASQFINLGFVCKVVEDSRIDLRGNYCGIDDSTIRIEGTNNTTESWSAILPITDPKEDMFRTYTIARTLQEKYGVPSKCYDNFENCQIIGNHIINLDSTSTMPYFARWDFDQAYMIVVYTGMDIEYIISKK